MQNSFTDINSYNGTSDSSRSSTSSVESISRSNGKLKTQQSIVEVHSPPRDIMLDVIPNKPALPKVPASKSTLPASESPPKLSTSKSAPSFSVLKSTLLLKTSLVSPSPKSAPASPIPADLSTIPPTPPPLPPPLPPTPIESTPSFQTQKSVPSTFTFNKAETSKSKVFNGEYQFQILIIILSY